MPDAAPRTEPGPRPVPAAEPGPRPVPAAEPAARSAASRADPSLLHVDLDAFFAAVEQRDKPSLRGRPVVVGGVGPRGVVATASYEARVFGVQSAMATSQARARCPHAAYLHPRFAAYRETSDIVMAVLRDLSPALEPLSLDEAFVDLALGPGWAPGTDVAAVASRARAEIQRRTRVTASIGAATGMLLAKIASELAKPDGLLVVAPGSELDLLQPLPVRRLWGVGPVTADRLARLGVRTVAELAALTDDDVAAVLGQAHGRALHRLARGEDDRVVQADRAAKSVSVEDTFAQDVTDRAILAGVVTRMAATVCGRMAADGLSGRTVTVKVRRPDFSTRTRASTLPGPTDDPRVVARVARGLLAALESPDGFRLVGVGMSGLTDWVQQDLFAREAGGASVADDDPTGRPTVPAAPVPWVTGADVCHDDLGRGWVWGAGRGRVTVRFETRDAPPGPVRTFAEDDPSLTAVPPLPLPPVSPHAPDRPGSGRARAPIRRR